MVHFEWIFVFFHFISLCLFLFLFFKRMLQSYCWNLLSPCSAVRIVGSHWALIVFYNVPSITFPKLVSKISATVRYISSVWDVSWRLLSFLLTVIFVMMLEEWNYVGFFPSIHFAIFLHLPPSFLLDSVPWPKESNSVPQQHILEDSCSSRGLSFSCPFEHVVLSCRYIAIAIFDIVMILFYIDSGYIWT